MPDAPTMLNTDITQEPQHMTGIKPVLDTVIGSNAAAAAAAANVDQLTTSNNSVGVLVTLNQPIFFSNIKVY